MKNENPAGRRSIGDEIAFICERLGADEVQVLGRALRRGVFEIYKAVVLHEMEVGRMDRQEASRLLGEVVVRRILGERRGRGAAGRGAGRPGGGAGKRRPVRSGRS